MDKKEIVVTEETRAVVEHYLQKQWARREKRLQKKAPEKKEVYDFKTGKFIPGN